MNTTLTSEAYPTRLCRACRSPLPDGAVPGDRCSMCHEEETACHAKVDALADSNAQRDSWRACAESLRDELARVQAIVGPVDYDLIAPHLAEFDNLTRKASAEPTRPVADPEEYSTPLCRDCRSPLPVGAVTGDRCPICQEEESQWQAHAEEAACHAPEGGAR